MSGLSTKVIVALNLLYIASAAPSAQSVNSGLQNLAAQRPIRYTPVTLHRTGAVVVLDTPQTQSQAASSCSAIGESLWTPPSDLSANDFLAYLTYQPGVETRDQWHHPNPPYGPGNHGTWQIGLWQHYQLYFIAGQAGKGGYQAISPKSKTSSVDCNSKLPALCTQSAALSGINITDTSAKFQTSVPSGNAVYTGYRDKLWFRFLGIQYGSYPERFTYSPPVDHSGVGVTLLESADRLQPFADASFDVRPNALPIPPTFRPLNLSGERGDAKSTAWRRGKRWESMAAASHHHASRLKIPLLKFTLIRGGIARPCGRTASSERACMAGDNERILCSGQAKVKKAAKRSPVV
ncbi:hypothetical protein LTR78_010666 [Recurvomyces mirabilis]|uniref:Uncharacterized protein n=1 Tax=Recurvomyces mirabilis TaxID=574656 RepID=A0AAE0TPC2_9PEZI|nr:hypothetical protein LTR78_010666 [Recurvomyces mirabilis]KAK5149537.1 hypothetical protein LTS14_010863 [Recurvomyces mirabilis]